MTLSATTIAGTVYHPDAGAGVRITGSSPVGSVIVINLNWKTFSSIVDDSSYLALAPNKMFLSGSRSANLCNMWQRFRFTRFRLSYVPDIVVAGQTAGTAETGVANVICYSQDAAEATSSTDANSFFRNCESGTNVIWNPMMAADFVLDRQLPKDLYYTDGDTGTDAGYRQSFQGLCLFARRTISFVSGDGTATLGGVYAHYEIELYGPRIVRNIALGGTDAKMLASKATFAEKEKEKETSKPLGGVSWTKVSSNK